MEEELAQIGRGASSDGGQRDVEKERQTKSLPLMVTSGHDRGDGVDAHANR